MANQYNDLVQVKLKLVNGKELPSILIGSTAQDESTKYLFVEIENKSDTGLFVTMDIFSPNNPNLKFSNFATQHIPHGKKFYSLLYANHPLMKTSDDKVELEYEIKKVMQK